MPTIRQLSPSVINKIAAGEVIERPASVVKELVENSVDAGAKRVEVAIGQGGSELIRVTDNGCGIDADQLELAVASHATSKIRDADDLFQVTSLGFRGEALASIAEVSHFRIRSRTSDNSAGMELEVNGGVRSEVVPCGCPVGTTIEVRNLFFNTPVRRKFLRTTQTEMGHITESLTRIALAHDDVHFVLTHNGRAVHELPANTDWRSRISTIFGRELAESLIWVDSGPSSIRVYGYVADPAQNRSHNRMQYVFLNRRHIRDRTLMHALSESYRGLIMTGRFPIAFLRLEIPPELVDVNVHPTKLEVRFQDSGQVYQKLLGSIRSRFLNSDLTARASLAAPPATPVGVAVAESGTSPSLHSDVSLSSMSVQESRSDLAQVADGATIDHQHAAPTSRPHWLNRAAGAQPVGTPPGYRRELAAEAAGEPPIPSPPRQPELGLAFERRPVPSFYAASGANSASAELGMAVQGMAEEGRDARDGDQVRADIEEKGRIADETGQKSAVAARTAEGAPALQVYNRYLITETDEGLAVIDQHALHERVLYEQLREKVLSATLEVQRLLVPEIVQLTPSEAAAVLEHCEELARLGIEVSSFGGDTVLVSAYPAMLVKLRPDVLLREVAERLQTPEKQTDRRDLMDSILHMMACKGAIKAGDRLTSEEISALIQHRHVVQDAHHCPHGRPTTLIFTRDELDRRFKRI